MFLARKPNVMKQYRIASKLVGRNTPSFLPKKSHPRFFASSSALAQPETQTDMFCFQCEQTEGGTGCTTVGVCGKEPAVANMQDIIVQLSTIAAEKDDVPLVMNSMFTTLTNVNFDEKRMVEEIEKLRELIGANIDGLPPMGASVDEYNQAAKQFGVKKTVEQMGENEAGVRELIVYAMKGVSAYFDHALKLDNVPEEKKKAIYAEYKRLMTLISKRDANADLNELVQGVLDAGALGQSVLAELEAAHLMRFGKVTPAKAALGHKKGKAILVSGHDLDDLEAILKKVEGSDINVYTHGEMLPAHGYEGLRKHPNLAGHYGGPWQLQQFDFAKFPGPIVMTSNCIIKPRKSYQNRIFTMNSVGYPGVEHLLGHDALDKVVQSAADSTGFAEDKDEGHLSVGWGADFILENAETVLKAIKAGEIEKFFVIGGCDGNEQERSYFTDLAKATDDKSIILTLGCGKYRFNKALEGQSVAGLPKVMDLGQCNDSYGAARVAMGLADALGTKNINDLPLHFGVSWFEQKAVLVLCILLNLGIQNIKLGPNLPAFVTPAVLDVLVEKYNIAPTVDPKSDFNL